MFYQLSWETLPGLKGLSCCNFRATPTNAPDNERGVAADFSTESERDAFLRRLEDHFKGQRFSSNAAAFEAVKAFVLDRLAGRC